LPPCPKAPPHVRLTKRAPSTSAKESHENHWWAVAYWHTSGSGHFDVPVRLVNEKGQALAPTEASEGHCFLVEGNQHGLIDIQPGAAGPETAEEGEDGPKVTVPDIFIVQDTLNPDPWSMRAQVWAPGDAVLRIPENFLVGRVRLVRPAVSAAGAAGALGSVPAEVIDGVEEHIRRVKSKLGEDFNLPLPTDKGFIEVLPDADMPNGKPEVFSVLGAGGAARMASSDVSTPHLGVCLDCPQVEYKHGPEVRVEVKRIAIPCLKADKWESLSDRVLRGSQEMEGPWRAKARKASEVVRNAYIGVDMTEAPDLADFEDFDDLGPVADKADWGPNTPVPDPTDEEKPSPQSAPRMRFAKWAFVAGAGLPVQKDEEDGAEESAPGSSPTR
jgi:hypothetical protein